MVFLAVLAVLLPAAPANAYTDDYAYRYDTSRTTDPWGFTKRQCVSYAAWRLYKAGHPIRNSTQHWGNGAHWDDAARALRKVVTTRPKVGAIAQWNAYERSTYYPSTGGTGTIQAGSTGHVAWVAAVYSNGSVLVRQYNLSGNRAFSQLHVRAPRYIYVY